MALEGGLHIWQVNYWAREQCINYFGLIPEQVVAAVKGQVARADVLEDGAYIVVSYDPMKLSKSPPRWCHFCTPKKHLHRTWQCVASSSDTPVVDHRLPPSA